MEGVNKKFVDMHLYKDIPSKGDSKVHQQHFRRSGIPFLAAAAKCREKQKNNTLLKMWFAADTTKIPSRLYALLKHYSRI